MLTKGDDYPLHQTPEPMAVSGGNRNFYDRYFFNGYSADGSIFFAAALGVYPQLDIMDAAFCVSIGGWQHNLRASKRMSSERLDLEVGPIRIEIIEPLQTIRLIVSADTADSGCPITADITFTARHNPIEEPRFTRRDGPRLMMDYTRMTQNGAWSGAITMAGKEIKISPDIHFGTRDRSWGIRPVGAPESQPPPARAFPQFWWLWTPLNFPGHACFFHSNDDGEGVPWNRRGVVDNIAQNAGVASHEFEPSEIDLSYFLGTRRIKQVDVQTGKSALSIAPRSGKDARTFYMSGLGYMHPTWGHGMDHGELEVGYDVIDLSKIPDHDMLYLHIQALSDAILTSGDYRHDGIGVVEQLFVGPHATSRLTGMLDGIS